MTRLWHASTLLREYRRDSHVATLLAEGNGGTEAGCFCRKFGWVHHLPPMRLTAVEDSMRARGPSSSPPVGSVMPPATNG